MKRKLLKLTFILFIASMLTACGKIKPKEQLLGINYNVEGHSYQLEKYETKNPLVALYIKNYGSVVIELYPEIAPNTVANFIHLVESGFYDNNTFHRLMKGFVLQGGDPTGTGSGNPGYRIKGEFNANGFTNNLKHDKAIVSMARTNLSYDSAGCQFFIMLDKAEYLDGQYASFGKVIDGWDTIVKIENNEKVIDYQTGKLKTNLTIVKALVDLKGKAISDVEKIME